MYKEKIDASSLFREEAEITFLKSGPSCFRFLDQIRLPDVEEGAKKPLIADER